MVTGSQLRIEFQSLDRIQGREGKSKLLAKHSELYTVLHQINAEIRRSFVSAPDRMDLHIEITRKRRDPLFRTIAESLHAAPVDLGSAANWDYLGRAFVLWTPEVKGYGRTHITVAYFGKHEPPSLDQLRQIVLDCLGRLMPSG